MESLTGTKRLFSCMFVGQGFFLTLEFTHDHSRSLIHVLCCVVLCCVVLCCVVLCRVVSCRVVSCRVVSCRVVLCCALLCCVVLLLCYVVLCCVVNILWYSCNNWVLICIDLHEFVCRCTFKKYL